MGITLHFRELKELHIKTTQLGILTDKSLCPTSTLLIFKEKSEHLRVNLPKEHTFFLVYVEDPTKVKSVRLTTVTNWNKENMKKADIDKSIYKAHSLRSASSTKAVQNGHSIQNVKQYVKFLLLNCFLKNSETHTIQ